MVWIAELCDLEASLLPINSSKWEKNDKRQLLAAWGTHLSGQSDHVVHSATTMFDVAEDVVMPCDEVLR